MSSKKRAREDGALTDSDAGKREERAREEAEDDATWRLRPTPRRSAPGLEYLKRMKRAKVQRMYLIDGKREGQFCWRFAVLGSTGNVYTVKISQRPSCDCPDASKGHTCKHIILIFLKVLKRSETDHLIFQTGLTKYELVDLFSKIPPSLVEGGDSVLANEHVRKAFQDSKTATSEACEAKTTQKPLQGAECLICFESFPSAERVVWCKTQCGYNFHEECFRKWASVKTSMVNCPSCRADWPGSTPESRKAGYQNLAQFETSLFENQVITSLLGSSSSSFYSVYRRRNHP
jgi:hypothetical protein